MYGIVFILSLIAPNGKGVFIMARKLPAGMRKKPGRSTIEYRFYVGDKQYSVCGTTVSECRERELQKREEIKAGTYTKDKNLTVSEYMERWIERRRQKVKPSTIRTYKKLNNRMKKQKINKAGHIFGDIELQELETENVYQMQQSLLRDGLATRTANDTLSLLNHALETALNERVIEWNPVKAVERLNRTEEPARDTIHRALTREEVESFLNAARESWYFPLYVFLLHTGLRIGEAAALTVRDVTDGIINITKTVTRTESGYIIAEQTKTDAGRRKIDTRPEAWKAFNDQRRINEIFNSGKVASMNKPVFTLPKGGIIRPDRVNSDIKKFCEATGIEYFTSHAFRATFASRCIAAGMDVKLLMEILGHTDVQMTLGLYGHGEDEKRRAQVMAVNF